MRRMCLLQFFLGKFIDLMLAQVRHVPSHIIKNACILKAKLTLCFRLSVVHLV